MKAVRISLLTMVLMVGATSRPAPTVDNSSTGDATAISQSAGPCYLINGMWFCEP
jgi:hypothetical protein